MIIIFIIVALIVVLFFRMLYLSLRQKSSSLSISSDGILLHQYEGPFKKKPELNDLLWEGWNIKTYRAKYNNSREPLLFKGSELANVYVENSLSEVQAMGGWRCFWSTSFI